MTKRDDPQPACGPSILKPASAPKSATLPWAIAAIAVVVALAAVLVPKVTGGNGTDATQPKDCL